MKNILKKLGGLILTASIVACSNTSKFEDKFTGDELKAVQITEMSLPRGAKMEECRVVKSKLPLAMLVSEYKSVRDEVNKARLDYRSCITRGLTAYAQKNVETLEDIQKMLREKAGSLESDSPEYLFVLAKVKEPGANNGRLTGMITVFDASTMEKVDLVQVTTPLFNNAVMVTEAMDGTLGDPTANTDVATLKSDNPVVSFILSCNPK